MREALTKVEVPLSLSSSTISALLRGRESESFKFQRQNHKIRISVFTVKNKWLLLEDKICLPLT